MTLEKILRYVVIIGAFLFPLIPFIVSPSMFFPFITGKNFTFRILVEVVFVAWAVLAYLSPKYRPTKKSLILFALSAFVLIIALADALGVNPFKSFWSNFERMEGFVTIVHLLMYFVALSSVLNAEKLWVRLAGFSLGMSVIMALYGLLQKAGKLEIHQSGTRLDATLGNATYLAVYMIFHVFIAALLTAYARSKNALWALWLLLPVMFLDALILFFTETRGAALGLVGGAFVSLLAYALLEGGRIRKFALGGLAVLVLLIGGFFMFKNASWVPKEGPIGRLATISLDAGNVRFMVWNTAWQGAMERPVLGWGQDGFNYVFNKYYNPEMYAQEAWFDRAHNVFLDWLIAGGFLGLFSYLSLFAVALYYLWLYRRNGVSPFTTSERAIITGLLAAYFFHNIFVFDNLVSYIYFMLFLAYIHMRAVGMNDISTTRVDPTREALAYRFVLPVALVVLCGGMYFVNAKGIITNHALLKAISPQSDISKNADLFEEAYAYRSLGKQEVAEQYLLAATQVGTAQVDDSVKQKFLDGATSMMEKELEETPHDARLLIFMSSTYNAFGLSEKALPYAERALEDAPNKQYALFEVATGYFGTGDLNKALELSKKAYDLEPKFREAAIFYSIMLIRSGEIQKADSVMEPFGGIVGSDDGRILNALVVRKEFTYVIGMWQKRVETDPTDVQKLIGLAAAYLNAGRRTESIQTLQKAIELEPQFKAQGEYYINEIRAGRNP